MGGAAGGGDVAKVQLVLLGPAVAEERREPVGYGNQGVACELGVRGGLGFGGRMLFFHAEAT
jgi:hypothetical protein